MVSIIIVVAAGILVVDSRLRSALIAYVVFTASVLWISHPRGSEATFAGVTLFAALAFVKTIVGPAAVLWLKKRYGVPNDLAPSFNLGVRCAIVAVALLIARALGSTTAFSAVPDGTIAFYAIFTSVCVVIAHRNLLAHVVGLLALGSAVTLTAAIFAPALPGAIELADTFDAVFATFIALAVARAVAYYDPQLDIRSLRGLRG